MKVVSRKGIQINIKMKSNKCIDYTTNGIYDKRLEAIRSRVPVLTWESYKGNARTRDTYRTVCFITRRTC